MMGRNGRCNDDRIDPGICQDFVEVCFQLDRRIPALDSRQSTEIGVTDHLKFSFLYFGKVADQVLTPIPAADNSHSRFTHGEDTPGLLSRGQESFQALELDCEDKDSGAMESRLTSTATERHKVSTESTTRHSPFARMRMPSSPVRGPVHRRTRSPSRTYCHGSA